MTIYYINKQKQKCPTANMKANETYFVQHIIGLVKQNPPKFGSWFVHVSFH